jgi:hypothetical protein
MISLLLKSIFNEEFNGCKTLMFSLVVSIAIFYDISTKESNLKTYMETGPEGFEPSA